MTGWAIGCGEEYEDAAQTGTRSKARPFTIYWSVRLSLSITTYLRMEPPLGLDCKDAQLDEEALPHLQYQSDGCRVLPNVSTCAPHGVIKH
jgi:hypothetical protein